MGKDGFDVSPMEKTKGDEEPPKEAAKNEHAPVPFLKLYKYATGLDKCLIFLASVLVSISGVCYAVTSLVFGDATGAIVRYVSIVQNATAAEEIEAAGDDLQHAIIVFVVVNTALAVGILVTTYFSTVLFNYCALRQTFKIRDEFFRKILNQDIGWYDVHQTGDFASRIADDLKKIEEGIGEKVSIFLFYEAIVISSVLQGLIRGWLLALVCMVSFPVSTGTLGFIAWISSKLAKKEMDSYAAAGVIAEETLSAIRTVVAFGGQPKEEERYDKELLQARENNIKRAFFNGISNGVMWFVTYASFSLAFWYGVKLILQERHWEEELITYDAGNMITIFFSILTGVWFFGSASPYIETFAIARGAAAKIFGIIASEPVINASLGGGVKPNKLEGHITFRNVHFHYPSRPDIKILQGLELKVTPAETVALVGSSGCGKSTIVQLIQRFYDPLEGEVSIDGTDIKKLDLAWLRSNIGVVGQEPVLFEASIAENIRYGCLGATQEQIEKAARKANAHIFITALPDGYSTMVGERGAQLSGGQKQRIAIARALVRDPSILLLDEATSALDTRSEAVVQAALDAASNECTTIIVAHRLSTVRKADRIVVLSQGRVEEEGSHDALMLKKGAYHQLVTAQIAENVEDEENAEKARMPRIDLERQKSIESTNSIYSRSFSFQGVNGDANVELIQEEKPSSSSILAILRYNKREWWLLLLGCVSSVVNGAAMPIYAIIFGNVMGVLADPDDEYVQNETNKLAVFFLVLGTASGVANFLQTYSFGIAGEKLTWRLRSQMYKAMLKQEMAWYDSTDNGVGSLCARLSSEPASVQGATGQRIGAMLNAFATIVIALGSCLYFDWRISLVALCFSPIIILSIYMEQRIISKESQSHYKALQKSTKIGVEAISNIRTVASLGCEETFHDRYIKEIVPYQKAAQRNTHFRGLVYGVSRSLIFFAYSAALYYGVVLIKEEGLDYAIVFTVAESLIASSWSLANALAFTPNFNKGLIAAQRILMLLHREPTIQNGSQNVDEKWSKGNIEYQKVYFAYPNRPTAAVLKGLNLSILEGKMVALVGPSGCGKSTIIQLLERFYDPIYGEVTVGGKATEAMHLAALRSHLGIVSQEPNLFSKTIADNIAYGDNSREVDRSEIIAAAKNANIHNFIVSLPLGYETKLGEKGTQLSGGQKQRVAIARALVRNPKVLLLDEATSALDAESEKVVQEALDNAKVGRTCISIAHRLTTIQDADVICVINHGKVAEMGTHSELIALKRLYYNLYSLQSGSH